MKITNLFYLCFVLAVYPALGQTTFSNTNAITTPSTVSPITAPQKASPYPSQITVSGLTGTISKITVTLTGWTENGAAAFPGDRDFMLVGPGGQTFEFLGDVGSFNTFSNITLTLDDSAASGLTGAQLVSGTFKPTNRSSNFCTNFPTPAPASSNCAASSGTSTFASLFNGINPNGTWSLYIFDPFEGDSPGSISNGWTLTITVAAAANTTTTVTSNLNPSFTSSPNNMVTLTAQVTKTSDGSNVTESSVTFMDGVTGLGTIAVNGSGLAALPTSFATEGAHTISAVFNSDSNFATSTGTLTQNVDNHTTGTPPTFCDTGSITLNSTGAAAAAAPYPQHVYVAGLSGSLTEVSLQLPGISHNFPDDIDFLLVSPTGATLVPLASAGGGHSVSGVTLTLSDSAGSLVPAGSLASGTFLPSDYHANISFPSPAPTGPYQLAATQGSATFGTSFAGINPNGMWSLYAFDHAAGDSGSVGGYCLTFITSSAATTTTMISANPSPAFVGDSVTFTAHVTSGGSNVTTGTVTFQQNGVTLAGPVTLDGNGLAAFTTSTLTEGIHSITALYSGSPGVFNISSGTVSEEVDHHTTVSGTTYCNPGGITIPANGATQPYPSRVFVANLPGVISKVTATLVGLTHAFPHDADMLLTGPTGTNLVFWAAAGGSTAVSGLNVTLDDAAASAIPSSLTSGTFKPTADNGAAVAFPSPAPSSLSSAATFGAATLASSFGGINANGTWSFYIFDSGAGSGGTIGQACLNFTETSPVLSISKMHSGNFTQGQPGTYTLTVTNNGPGPTGGTVTVTDPMPSGLTATAASGNNWSCSVTGGGTGISCNRSDPLASGTSYDLITLTVSVAASATNLTNSATVSGGGDPNNHTANDPTTITPSVVIVPSSQISTTSSGFLFSRVTRTFSGTMTITNISGSTITGPLSILFTSLPAGVTLVNATGTFSGSPFLAAPGTATLAAGQSATVNVQFSDPSNTSITVTPVIYSGSL